MTRLKRGDSVQIIAGKDKGKQGEILRVLADGTRVVVRGVNFVKKHVAATQANPKGGIISKEAALHASNVMPVDPQDGRPCRIGAVEREGRRVRVSRRTGAPIGGPA